MKRYRIAMIAACPFPAARGTPIRIQRIADELARRGHDVDVITYHMGSGVVQPAYRTHRIANVRTYQKESPGPSLQKLLILDPLLALKALRLARACPYDVIHAHHVEGLLAALPARRITQAPLVFDAHTLLESELPYYRLGVPRRLLGWLGGRIDAWLPACADHVIAVSEQIRVAMVDRAGLQKDSVSLIPNGVESQFFGQQGAATPAVENSVPRVVFSGNLAAYQGIDLLLEAFGRAVRQRPDLRLRILTSDSFETYEGRARNLGIRDKIDIRQVALVDLPGELSAATVAVNPRVACDGLPQKLLNYMAAGCPIVSFAGSARHLEHERTAWIVADGDVESFANGIVRLAGDRRLASDLGEHAREFVRARMSWGHAATRIEQVYDLLAGGPAGGV